jgi:release factor glutamine methyltransferase
MMPSEAARLIRESLSNRYDPREKSAITEWLMEDLTGLSRIDRLIRETPLSTEQLGKLQQYVEKLGTDMPVQYITGYAWFRGEKFRVNDNVLIPRPETEELVNWALNFIHPGMIVTDIGTGSGCIPVSIKKECPDAQVFAADISREALSLAQENARIFNTAINWLHLDILQTSSVELLPVSDIIISNPPYIPLRDIETMERHVTEHEPHLALFVPDEDALVFYRAILTAAEEKLRRGGQIFFETHYPLAQNVAALSPWPAEIRCDVFGKERMVRIERPL